MFAFPLLFLPVLWWANKTLPETRRYTVAADVLGDLSVNRRRFLLIGFSAFAGAIFLSPASQLQNEYLRDEQGFSATSISLFRMVISTPAGLGILVAGIIADRRGRRIIGAVGLGVGALATAMIYRSSGAMLGRSQRPALASRCLAYPLPCGATKLNCSRPRAEPESAVGSTSSVSRQLSDL
ncbi:MAG: hypothetical protein R2706_00155 [Acidimicrobiales bacterium]